MAERVYRRKSTAGVTPLASGYTSSVTAVAVPPSPQGEGFGGVGEVALYNANTAGVPTANVAEVASAGQTAGRVYRKKNSLTMNNMSQVGQSATRTYAPKSAVVAEKIKYQTQSVQDWFKEAEAVAKDTTEYVSNNQGKWNAAYGSDYTERVENLLASADDVASYIDYYLKEDEETYKATSDAFSQFKAYLADFDNYAAQMREDLGQFKSDEEYQEALAAAKEFEELLAVDVDGLEDQIQFYRDIQDLIKKYRDWQSKDPEYYYDEGGHGAAIVEGHENYYAKQLEYYGFAPYDAYGNSLRPEKDVEKKLHDAENLRDKAKQARVQNAVAGAKSDEGFQDYVSAGKSKDNPILANYDKIAGEMTKEQKNNYYYLRGKFGQEDAEIYFELVRDSIKAQHATDFYETYMKDRWYEGAFNVVQGLDSVSTGVQNAFGNHYTDDRLFDPQLVGSLVRENLSDTDLLYYDFKEGKWKEQKIFGSSLGQSLYDAGTNITAQLPAIGVGAASNLLIPGSGVYVKRALMGVTAAGGAHKEALDMGYTPQQAREYALINGVSEIVMEKVLNGIGIAGDSLVGGALTKATSGIKNATVKNLMRFGGSLLSEGAEEWLQEILTPVYENIALDADNTWEDIDWEAAAYAGLLGAASAGVFNGAGIVTSVVQQHAQQNAQLRTVGRQFINGTNGLNIDKAIAIGLDNAKGTDAYNAAVKIQQRVRDGKAVSAYAVGRMVAESQTKQAKTARAIERTVLSTAKEWNIPTDAADTVSAAAVSLGQKVEFVSPEGMHNRYMAGEYDSSTDTVRLNAAERNVDKLIGAVLAHEMVHTAEGTDQLQKLAQIAERMENHKNGADAWEQLQADVKRDYAKANKQLSDPGVKKETLAYWIAENLFQNKAFAKAVVDGDANVGNAFFYMIDRVRRAMGVKKASAGNLAMLERLFMQALDNRTLGPREGDVQYGMADDAEGISIKNQLRNAQDQLSKMDPVVSIETPKDFSRMTKPQVFQWALKELSTTGYKVDRRGFGIIVFDSKRLNNGLRYLNRADEYAAFATIPRVLKRGIEIHSKENHKSREYSTVTIAAPVEINGKRGNVAITIAQTTGNYYKTHRVLMPDGAQFVFEENEKQSLLRQGALSKKDTHALPIGSVSNTNVAQNSTDVNTQSMQEGAGISAQGALLSPESMEAVRNGTWREARAEGGDPNANVDSGVKTPYVADGDTSLGEGGLRAVEDARPYGANLSIDEAAVLESAVRSGLQGKQVVDVDPTMRGVEDVAPYIDTLEAELGEPELLRRMWNAAQMHRLPGMVEIDGKRVDANAYVDAYEQSLPDDPVALERHIQKLQEQRAAEMAKMEQEGTLEDHRFGGLKIDLQLFAATRKWDLLQLDAGENGKKARQFYEKRLRGTDANHNQELVDLLAGRSETYNPIASEATLEKAKNKLRDAKYQEKLIKRIGKYNPRDLFNAVDVAAAQVLINDAINDGELGVAADLISGLSRKGTELGRAVQAFSMMARLTPEGTLKAAIKTVKADADYAICEGANEGLDVLADDIALAIQEAEEKGISSDEIANRIRNGEGDASSTASGPLSSQGEGYGVAEEPLTPEQISKMQNLTPGKRVSFYDLTDEQVQAFAPLENRLYRELKNKSPFIRRRFGEWRVRDKTPVQIATKAGQKRGVQKNTDTGWNIQVSGKVFGENRGHFGSSSIAARPYLAYINDITRNAVLLDTSTLYEGKSPNSLCMHTLYALADIGDGPQLLKLYVEEMYDPSQKGVNRRAYELLNIESQPIGAKGSQQNAVSPVTLPTDTPTIADLIAIVKSKDASYKPKAPEDVLVDDLAATEGTFLTRDDVADIVEKAVNDATNIPEQLKRYVLKKIRKDDGGLAQRIYELHKRGDLKQVKLRRAMEEALELPTLTDEDLSWIAKQGAKIESLQDKPVEQADAMEELYDFLGAKLTVTGLDRLQAWRKFGMLFNVKTHLRNIFSNGAYAGIRKADDAVAMVLERIFVHDSEQRGAALGWRYTKHGKNILPQLQERADLAVLEMQKRGAKYEQGVGMLKQKRKYFGESKAGEALNKANRWNSDMLEAEDVWFFRPAYIDALGQIMTARKATEITEDMHQIAMQRALEATFRADNAISDVISSLKRFQNTNTTGKRLFGHGVDVVIPFHKTPANIATQTVMHSPVGIVKGAFDLYNAVHGKGSKDAATAINTMAKGVTGTALLIIGLLLGQAGLFNTGFGKTEKERAADEMAGLQEGSFVIGGVSISLDWLQPAASPLIVGASIAERMNGDGFTIGDFFGAVMDGTDSLFEMTMLQSLYDILGGYDAGASGTLMSVGENLISQSVPTVVGQLARAIDPVQRKTKGDSDFETIVNQVMAKIPGLTYLLDPELDVWGNEVYRTGKPGTGTTVLNALQQVLIPANTKVGTGKGDPISEEILRLYADQGGAVIPTAVTRDEAAEMGEDYVDVNRLLGGTNRLAVEEFVGNKKAYDVMVETGELTEKGNPRTKKETKYYRDMTDDERRRVLSRIYKATKAEVTGDTEGKTESQLTDSERYIRELLRRVRKGDTGTNDAVDEQAQQQPEQPKQEDTSYYEDLLRRMKNGN